VAHKECRKFLKQSDGGRRVSDQQLFNRRFRLDIRRYAFCNIVIDTCNSSRCSAIFFFILILMMVWSKRGNINTAAVVTIVQCNTLVARCSRQLIGPADSVFVTLGPLRCD